MDETVKFSVEFNTGQAVAGANEFKRALEGVLGTAKQVGAASPFAGMQSMLGAVPGWAAAAGVALGGVVAGIFSIRAAVDAVTAGIKNADYLRDLRLSMDALTGSTEEGAKAFERLEEAGKSTRVTGDELIKMFGESLPLALKRGFSVEAAEKWVTQIAKAAPALGMTVKQAMDQADQILAGRVRGTNVLAAALGLDAKAYTAGLQNLSSVFDKLNEVAGAGEKMGQTFASAAHKIKDELTDAFSEGFNEARGGVDTGINSILEAFRNPELLDAIHDLGQAVADILPVVMDTFIKIIEGATAMINDLRGLIAMFKGDIQTMQEAALRSAPEYLPTRTQEIQEQVATITGAQQQGPQLPAPLRVNVGRPMVMAEDIQKTIEAGTKWNSTLDANTDKTKNVIDGTEKYAGTLEKLAVTIAQSELAFKKLFTPPETNPLLRQLQDLDDQTAAFVLQQQALADKLRIDASKAGVPPEVARGMREAADAFDALAARSDAGRAAMAAWKSDKFFEDAMAAGEVATRKATTAMDDFIESTTQRFNLEGMSGLAQGIGEQLEAINREMKEKISVAKWLGLGPEAIAQIEVDAEKAGRAIVDGVDPVLRVASERWKKQWATLLDVKLPAGTNRMAWLTTASAPMAEEFIKTLQIHLPVTAEQAGEIFAQISAGGWEEEARKAALEFQTVFDRFAATISDALVGFAEGGADGFIKAMSGQFNALMKEGADALSEQFAKGLVGIFSGGKGMERGEGETEAEFASRQKTAGVVMASMQTAMAGIGETMRLMKEASLGKAPDVGMTTLSFALMGASLGTAILPGIGTAIGAAVGAIAGFLIGGAAKKKATESLPYAEYGFEGGDPYIRAAQGRLKQFNNVTESMMADMIATMTHTMEDTRNSYVKLLLKFPLSIREEFLQGMGEMDITGQKIPRGPHYEGATYDTMSTFQEDFKNWADNVLPLAIIDTFEAPLSKGFEALGLSAARFGQIWDRVRAIDPKDAINTLNNLYDALTAFRDFKEFATGRQLFGGAGFEFTGGYLQEAQAQNMKSFAQALAEADVSLVDMGASLQYLIGPEQIAQAAELGKQLRERQKQMEEFFRAIAQAIESTIQSYQSQIRELQLEGMVTEEGGPDVQRQVDFLKAYADSLYGKIQSATTPEQVAMYSSELSQTIMRIKQLGGTLGEDAAEAYRQWAITNLQKAQDLVVGRLEELAQMVADQNEAFLDAIQGFIDAFLEATEQITDANGEPPPGDEEPPPGGGPPIDEGDSDTHPNRDRYPPHTPPIVPPDETIPPGGVSWKGGTTPVPTVQTDQRELVLLLTEVRDVLRTGRDVVVHNELEVDIQGTSRIIYQRTGSGNGFARREIAARGR